jgi:hypothetical protein
MELDAPHWMCVNDERTWGGGGWGDSFSIDLYALVADGGTPVTAGQVMEIAGTFHFAEPVEVFEPQPIVAKVSDATGWKAALGLGVADVFGKELGLAPSMRMGVADDAPGVIEYTGQILDEPSKKPQFDVVRRVTVADDKSEMLVSQQLTALGVLRIQGVYSQVRLPRPQFDGCKAIFLNQGQPSVVLRDYTRPTSAIARAAAPSVRIDSTGGPLLTVTCKTATYWEMRVQPDAFVLCASFFEPILFVDMSRPVPKATTLREDLTIHWGK